MEKLPEMTAGISFVLDMPALKPLNLLRNDPAIHAAKYSCGCAFFGLGKFPEICPEHSDGRWEKDIPASIGQSRFSE